MSPEDIRIAKHALRKEMRNLLKNLSIQEKESASSAIRTSVKSWLRNHPEVTTVASFANLPIEPSLLALLKELPEIRWVFPHAHPDGTMHFYQIQSVDELETGLYGILQPQEAPLHKVSPEEIDCFLCPAFAYTRTGERLGKGGGYYDRVLKKRRAGSIRLGIIFQQQLKSTLPTEPHDISVDLVITD